MVLTDVTIAGFEGIVRNRLPQFLDPVLRPQNRRD